MPNESKEKNNITKAWQYYEEGRSYNLRLVPDQYSLVDTNIEFYAGNQWLHLPKSPAMASLPKPTFNIIKRVGNVQVASIMSSGMSIRLEPLSYYDGSSAEDPDSTACEFAQAEINNLIDKLKLEYDDCHGISENGRPYLNKLVLSEYNASYALSKQLVKAYKPLEDNGYRLFIIPQDQAFKKAQQLCIPVQAFSDTKPDTLKVLEELAECLSK